MFDLELYALLKKETATKQNKLIPGDGITIEDNIISAAGGSSAPEKEITKEDIDDIWYELNL